MNYIFYKYLYMDYYHKYLKYKEKYIKERKLFNNNSDEQLIIGGAGAKKTHTLSDVIICNKTTVEVIEDYKKQNLKCLVLSLGNSKNIGGGYQIGALGAQEESLCSTIISLFPSLQKSNLSDSISYAHKKNLITDRDINNTLKLFKSPNDDSDIDKLYSSITQYIASNKLTSNKSVFREAIKNINLDDNTTKNLLQALLNINIKDELFYSENDWSSSKIKYSKNMKLFRSENKENKESNQDYQLYRLKDESEWIDVDIITAASTNFSNKNCSTKKEIDELFTDDFQMKFKKIIYTICKSADEIYKHDDTNKPSILVLGALGAGAFMPTFYASKTDKISFEYEGRQYFQEKIACLFKKVLTDYKFSFKQIVFAITGKQYKNSLIDIFKSKMKE